MSDSLILQQPGGCRELMLLFHGVGATAQHLAPLGQHLAAPFPGACIVSIGAPEASDSGTGRQWFSLRGISDERRRAGLAGALPAFLATVQHWQRMAGVEPKDTTLIGFSQGGVMVLGSLQPGAPVAGRHVSIAGRLAAPPRLPSPAPAIHLLHGAADRVIPAAQSTLAAQQLRLLGANVTLDVVPRLAHAINAETLRLLTARLRRQPVT